MRPLPAVSLFFLRGETAAAAEMLWHGRSGLNLWKHLGNILHGEDALLGQVRAASAVQILLDMPVCRINALQSQ